jgi:hypothetical protein
MHTTTALKLKTLITTMQSHSGEAVQFVYASKNPGSWANNLKVCFIDDFADQTIGITTN